MALSLHIVVDTTSDARLDRALLYLMRTQQRVVNIAAGSQIDRGMQFVERVRQQLPNIDIIWRELEDTGIHTRMSPDVWWVARVAPRLAWFKKNRVIFLLDNESSGNDEQIKAYVAWELTCLRMLHNAGLNGAVCRFATGNIQDGANNQYKFLKPLLDELQAGDHVSPNEYSNAPGKSSSGHLRRYTNIEDVAGRQLNVSIGEAGVAPNYDPGKGYHSVMNDEQFVAQMLAEEIWYRNGEVDRCLFVVGGYTNWNDYQISDKVLELLEAYYAKNPIQPKTVTIPPVVVPPTGPSPTEDTLIQRKVWLDGAFNFRRSPSKSGVIIKVYPTGKTAGTQYVTIPAVLADGYSWHQYLIDGQEGWIADGVAVISDRIDPVPPQEFYVTANTIEQLRADFVQLSLAFAKVRDSMALLPQ